ncbi:MAG: class B sortase [Clostridia bacterium]|nr:class B sortase [Clostridia bacterium]
MEGNITGKKKILWVIALAISITVFTACIIYFVADYLHYRSVNNIGANVSNEASLEINQPKKVDVPIDFKKLQEINKDIYAWIRIPYSNETEKFIADYPILQSSKDEDRSYYLTHNVNRQTSAYGAIYTQNYNKKDFNDFNTLIYGHNMRNGTMFGTLKKYRDEKFFKENNEIIIYMPNRILKYRIFAAYVFDDRHILLSFDFNNETERQLYLDTVFSERKLTANFEESLTVDTDDKIITLSTCTSKDEERYLVQGVLVYDSNIGN